MSISDVLMLIFKPRPALLDHGAPPASYRTCCASQAHGDQSESDVSGRASAQALAEALATPFDKASALPAALMTQRFSLPGRKARAAAALARCGACRAASPMHARAPPRQSGSCALR